jgi:hypothetical protein
MQPSPSSERCGISRAGGRASLSAALLSCGRSASRSSTSERLRPTGSAHPPHGLDRALARPIVRLAVRRVRSSSPFDTARPLPQAWTPLQSFTRESPCPDESVHTALSRFFSPSTQPSRAEPPLPGLPAPGSCCVPAVPARPDALLPANGLPGMFQPGAPSGFSLQSLTWQVSRPPFGYASPHAIGFPVPRTTPFGENGLAFPFCPPRPGRSG